MKVKADNIGRSEYLTAGKEYEVICEKSAFIKMIKDDEGEYLYLRIGDPSGTGCAYIDGNEWTIIEDREMIERPLSLTPTHGTIFGTDESREQVQQAYDEAFKGYSELIDDGWQQENALRSAHMTLVGALVGKVHLLAEGVA